MTCFFDPSHGAARMTVTWVPQWGVPRPIRTCVACGQRVQSGQPPYYTPPAPAGQGYPQAGGYPGGYPQSGGYPQGYPGPDYADYGGYPPRRGGHSTGAVVGAGLAGLVGGALLGEALESFEEPRTEIIEENTYVENVENVDVNDYNNDFGGGDFGGDGDFADGGYDDGGYDDGSFEV